MDAGEVPKAFRVADYPFFYLLDRSGRIAARFESVKEVEDHLQEVLATPEAAPRRELRDTWQRPARVMDALGVEAGSSVADVGSGEGYFTLRLAARVGPKGRVFAVDIDEKALGRLKERAQGSKLATQVEIVHGAENSPKLPPESVDAILIVDSYHEFREYDAMLRGIFRALKPGGRLGILDNSDGLGRPRAEYQERHRLPVEILIGDAVRHGLRLKFFEPDFAGPPREAKMYYIIFEKPKP
jgi:ubiquinone/menaquinone biosynthesis C-methylase UbiE